MFQYQIRRLIIRSHKESRIFRNHTYTAAEATVNFQKQMLIKSINLADFRDFTRSYDKTSYQYLIDIGFDVLFSIYIYIYNDSLHNNIIKYDFRKTILRSVYMKPELDTGKSLTWDLFYQHGLTLIPSWISNHMPCNKSPSKLNNSITVK